MLALVVMCGHLTWFQSPIAPPPFLGLLGGTSAVLGFLFVSGYSIGSSLQRRPVGFFRRRFVRIYPLYVAAILFSLVPFISGYDALGCPGDTFPRPHVGIVIANLLMMQNLLCLPVDSDTLVWTLGVEVICYAVAPRLQKLPTPAILLMTCVSAAAFAVYPRTGFKHYSTLLWGLPLLMFAWAWLAGFVLHRLGCAWWAGVALALFSAALVKINASYISQYSTICVAGAALVVTFAEYIRVPAVLRSALNYAGDLSYPLYLFHLPAFILGYCVMEIRGIYFLTAMALAISAAFLFIESVLKPLVTRVWGRDALPTAG